MTPDATGILGAAGSVVTVGTFDGVHRGHQDVLDRLVRRAAATGLTPLLVTFEPHPLEVVHPGHAPALLTPGVERLEALVATALRHVVVVPFTPAFARLSAAEFVRDVLLERYRMRELLIGHDHGFGRRREGGEETLRLLGAELGFPVEVVPAVSARDGEHVSSTKIRHAVAAGDLAAAADGLGRRYGFLGRVVPGAQRGRALGFPTLNLDLLDSRKLLPAAGVYAVVASTPHGRFGGMMNLGARPTFDDPVLSPEVHLFDVDADFYGMTARIEFVARLREVQRFPSVDALVAQLRADADAARRALTEVA